MQRRLIRRVLLIAGLLYITLVVGTVGFRVEGYSWFDGFYMTLMTITTVGHQELSRLSRAGRLFNVFLILFGVSAMFLALGAMTQTIIELELQQARYDASLAERIGDTIPGFSVSSEMADLRAGKIIDEINGDQRQGRLMRIEGVPFIELGRLKGPIRPIAAGLAELGQLERVINSLLER